MQRYDHHYAPPEGLFTVEVSEAMPMSRFVEMLKED